MSKNKFFFILAGKIILMLILVIAYGGWLASYEPIFTNELAMQQMQINGTIGMELSMYSYFRNITWIVILIIGIVLFRKELVRLTRWTISKVKQNKNSNE